MPDMRRNRPTSGRQEKRRQTYRRIRDAGKIKNQMKRKKGGNETHGERLTWRKRLNGNIIFLATHDRPTIEKQALKSDAKPGADISRSGIVLR